MPPKTNPNMGKILVSFCVGLTAVGLGVATVYLPYYSNDAKARVSRVRQGRIEKGDESPSTTEAVIDTSSQGGIPAGSMWKNMKDK
eukprot:evm.model.NODE_2618_length_17309_cov_37.127159.4